MKLGSIPELVVRKALPRDRAAIHSILSGEKLPTAGVDDHFEHFLVSESKGKIVGTIGLEVHGQTGLLRSAAVVPDYRNKGIGDVLTGMILKYAREAGITEIVLLTTTAEQYFKRYGFLTVKRDSIVGEVTESEEFRGACPSTATVMKKSIH